LTTYDSITYAGRVLHRRASIAHAEAIACLAACTATFTIGMCAAASGGNGNILFAILTIISAGFARVALDAEARRESANQKIDKLAPRYLEQVEIDIREAARQHILATNIAISGGLLPDRRKPDDRPDSETLRAISASLAEGRDTPAIGEAA
jgi:hypothetical protein